MTEKELFTRYQKKNIPSGYISRRDCISFITDSIAEGFIILGVEGFELSNGSIVPNLDEILDFSYSSNSEMHKIFEEVIEPFFLLKANSDIYDIVIEK